MTASRYLVVGLSQDNMAAPTANLLPHRRLWIFRGLYKHVNKKNMSMNAQKTQRKRVLHVLLQASSLAIYSTVNSATTLVSTANQILVEIECTAGTVSRTVTKADMTISEVVNICMMKAAVEDVGCSSSWYRCRLHGGWIAEDSSCSSGVCGDDGNRWFIS
jgi:hypothetical protein